MSLSRCLVVCSDTVTGGNARTSSSWPFVPLLKVKQLALTMATQVCWVCVCGVCVWCVCGVCVVCVCGVCVWCVCVVCVCGVLRGPST